jgi:hypothetical protein
MNNEFKQAISMHTLTRIDRHHMAARKGRAPCSIDVVCFTSISGGLKLNFSVDLYIIWMQSICRVLKKYYGSTKYVDFQKLLNVLIQ